MRTRFCRVKCPSTSNRPSRSNSSRRKPDLISALPSSHREEGRREQPVSRPIFAVIIVHQSLDRIRRSQCPAARAIRNGAQNRTLHHHHIVNIARAHGSGCAHPCEPPLATQNVSRKLKMGDFESGFSALRSLVLRIVTLGMELNLPTGFRPRLH